MNIKLPKELLGKYEGIVDVRTKEEFEEGHIEGAVNYDIYSPGFAGNITELDKSKSYLVYCTSGSRSLQAVMFMRKNGFTKVENLGGGIMSLS